MIKSIVIARKDLKQSFRSAFALAFMFAIPLLITTMFYLMFGSHSAQPEAAFQPPVTRVVVANLDKGDALLAKGLSQSLPDGAKSSMGELVVIGLQNPGLAHLLTIEQAASETEAKEQVDQQLADVALMIPPEFSANYTSGAMPAEVSIYHDPSQSIGPGIVKSVLGQVLDSFSGVRIAVGLAASEKTQDGDAIQAAITAAQQYLISTAPFQVPSALIDLQALETPESAEQGSPLTSIIGPIMGGMMIFFAFFTGGYTAQSILKEDEQGTLARLFTTATKQSTILSGKFLAVGLTLLVQVSLLLAASRLVFNIQWGELAAVVLVAIGLIALATAFGIFLTSLMKNTRQGGAFYGGLMTVTGMIGMLTIFAGDGGAAGAVSLVSPQGWAVRGLTLAMNGASLLEVSINTLVMLALSSLLMAAGVWKFQRRFA